MEDEHVVLHIMTDIKSSRGNIAANFQNAIAAQLLPPIGVFWDIENIQVPKGKSASALVNAIRDRFFKRHREAEFMCVCDINKENKSIIHELNDAQVTVVHVDATSKNAADEKLRQCMRRFVDTHGTPATLLLISDDVNFATDLSDFRHRHHIRIVLLHRDHAPEPLLVCAHEHHNFSELTMDLPWRSPQKVLNNRPRDLIVTDLPANASAANIKKCLRRLSDNCGGKVARITKSKAIISFANADAAERAQKRMDKELVYGQKVSVNFLQSDSTEFKDYILRRNLFKDSNSIGGPSCSSGSSRESSPHNDRQENCSQDGRLKKSAGPFAFPAPPVFNKHNLPSILQSSPSQKFNHLKELHSNDNSDSGNERKFELFSSKNNNRNTSFTSDNMHTLGNVQENNYFPREGGTIYSSDQQKSVTRVSQYLAQDGSIKPDWMPLQNSQLNPSVIRKNMKPHVEKLSACPLSHMCPHVPSTLSVNFNNLSKENEIVNSSVQQNHHSGTAPLENGHTHGKADPVSCNELLPVELFVTNLDPSIEINEMKKILQCAFHEHVMVLHISMMLQPDGNPKAVVRVPSLQDAQYAISQLHRKKIGHKRISISHVTNDRNPPFSILKSEVVSLLKDIPSKRLPVFKFREMYEKRYNRAISVSEIYKMRDAVTIQEEASGRMVSLNMEYRNTPSPTDSESVHSQELPTLEKPYCERHFRPLESQGWAEQQGIAPLPDVCISLKTLSPAVHTLLDSHQGSLPLNSFCSCYEADIGPLPVVISNNGDESLTQFGELSVSGESRASRSSPSRGIPLEHLISCIAGVEIVKSRLCIKKVQWCENRSQSQPTPRSISPALAGPLAVFGREMMDLLKNQPRCIVLFNKFIPIYHHHFGRQCRVADYGFTKLIDLLEAIPHIIQVLGDGQTRLVTLTHRMQVKRFAADLLRILKGRASKQMELSEFPTLYEQSTEKVFDITNYGVCELQDMLAEVSENTVVITHSDDDSTLIAIPKREQTKEEVEKTVAFSSEVIELLKHTPTCSMSFNKFIPAYHHHFGKQCRVADYGFSKLIELFEAIPVIEVTGTGEDKIVNLAEKERNEILADRLVSVLKAQPNKMIALHMLGPAYVEMHGHVLRPSDFGAADMPDLLRKLGTSLKVVEGYAGAVVKLVDSDFIHQVSLRIRRLLMEQKEGQMTVEKLNHLYQKRFGHSIDLGAFKTELEDVVKVESGIVKLMPLQLYARDMMLAVQGGKVSMSVSEFENAFFKHFGVALQPSLHGFTSVTTMLLSLKDYFIVGKRRKKCTIQLNRENCGSPLNITVAKDDHGMNQKSNASSQELPSANNRLDILNEPIPSGVPSPALAPQSTESDLMGFETPLPVLQGTVNVQSDPGQSTTQQGCQSASPSLLATANASHNSDLISTLGNFAYLPAYNNLLPCPGPSLAYIYPPAAFSHQMAQHAALYMQQSALLPVRAMAPGSEAPSCNMQMPVASPPKQCDANTSSGATITATTDDPGNNSKTETPLQAISKTETKECASPPKIVKLTPKDGSQTSLTSRRSGGSRIAAQFSNPV